MSTGSISLDILLEQIKEDSITRSEEAIEALHHRYPSHSEKEVREIHRLVCGAFPPDNDKAELVVIAPPSFSIKAKSTKVTVQDMITNAQKSILITGYSLSDYFSDLIDCIIDKSQRGVFVKFFVNDINSQNSFEKLSRYKGKFLKIYNYQKSDDKMAALHAKVISVDQAVTLITSANLSYHGQEGSIELGTRIFSREIAKQLDDVFTRLIFSKVFVEVK